MDRFPPPRPNLVTTTATPPLSPSTSKGTSTASTHRDWPGCGIDHRDDDLLGQRNLLHLHLEQGVVVSEPLLVVYASASRLDICHCLVERWAPAVRTSQAPPVRPGGLDYVLGASSTGGSAAARYSSRTQRYDSSSGASRSAGTLNTSIAHLTRLGCRRSHPRSRRAWTPC